MSKTTPKIPLAPNGRSVRTVVATLVVGLLGVLPTSAADAATATLLYTCSGPGFGSAPSYGFQVIVDTDLPASLPYGSDRVTSWTSRLVAPDSFSSWAQAQGYTVLYAGARLGTALDGVAQPTQYQTTPGLPVPATTGPWTWATNPVTTVVAASNVGHHAFTVTSLEVTVAFLQGSTPKLATSATCVLDPGTPPAASTVDAYDVVAATTTTALALTGDTVTATVTSNGAAPAGTVTFSAGGKSVTMGVTSGKAAAKLPSLAPGIYPVSATFAPTQPSQQTTSTGTASYTAPRLATTSKAFASQRPARELIRVRARVAAPDAAPDGASVSGRVTFILMRNGRTLQNATVWLSSESVAKKRFRGVPSNGRYLVVAKYVGTSTFKPSSDRVRLTLP